MLHIQYKNYLFLAQAKPGTIPKNCIRTQAIQLTDLFNKFANQVI